MEKGRRAGETLPELGPRADERGKDERALSAIVDQGTEESGPFLKNEEPCFL